MSLLDNNYTIQISTEIERFFTALYGDNPPGWLTLMALQKINDAPKTYWYSGKELARAITTAERLSSRYNVYFGLGLRDEKLPGNQRGKSKDVIAIPGFWVEIDYAGGVHAAKPEELPPTIEAARELINGFPLKPSIIVLSGGGLHAYWLFSELWVFMDDKERDKAAALLRRFQKWFKATAQKHGWKVDTTSDLARVLRVPGTFNRKDKEPVPVEIMEFNSDLRYSPEEIAEHLPEPEQMTYLKRQQLPVESNDDLPNAEIILEKCNFLNHTKTDAATLSEPEWYCMVSNIARTDGGLELVHELSKPYPRYEPAETDRKIEHALEDTGPHTCQYIRDNFGQWCQNCTHQVTSPIQLGRTIPSMEPDEPVEPFPVEALPDCFIPFVSEAAEALCCPVDFIAVPLIALAGAAIGTTRVVLVKQGWTESASLYAAIVGRPGDKKSPALELAQEPLTEQQKELKNEWQKELEEYEIKYSEWQAEHEQWKKAIKKGNAGIEPKEPQKPAMKRTYTSDTTVEALAALMAENPRGLALIRDELAGWVLSLNQYRSGKGADKQFYLSVYSGKPMPIDRKGAEPIFLERTFLTVCGGIQPDLLNELTDERGREEGFIHRILFTYPEPVPQKWTDAIISKTARERVRNVFKELFRLAHNYDENMEPVPVAVPLSTKARETFKEWYEEHQQEIDSPGFQDNLRGPWAKMPGQLARIALIIHLCRQAANETDSQEIGEETIIRAAAITQYFKSHTRKVYRRLHENVEDKKVRRTLTWLKKHGRAGVKPRDILSYKVGGCKDMNEAKAILDKLVKRGLGEWVAPPEGRGRKAKKFILCNTLHSAEMN